MSTLDELLHLADRAERGALVPGEAELLRAGIHRLEAARRSSGGAQAEARRLRQRIAEGELALADAVRERDRYAERILIADARTVEAEQQLEDSVRERHRLVDYLSAAARACGAPNAPSLPEQIGRVFTRAEQAEAALAEAEARVIEVE